MIADGNVWSLTDCVRVQGCDMGSLKATCVGQITIPPLIRPATSVVNIFILLKHFPQSLQSFNVGSHPEK